MRIRIVSLFTRLAALAIVLSPILLLLIKGAQGYCFFTVLVAALIWLCHADNARRALAVWRSERWFVAGMLVLPALLLFQVLVLRTGTWAAFDPFLRLALVVPGFAMLASFTSRSLRRVQWGFVLGAISIGLWAAHARLHPETWSIHGRLGNSFVNPIPFGDTALLLGFLALISLTHAARVSHLGRALRIMALLLGGYASFLSGSRGGWIALPVLLWATFAGSRGRLARPRVRWALAGATVACAALFAVMGVVHQRIEAAVSDVSSMERGNHDTSLGLRYDLWRASTRLYERHPVFGVGRGHLRDALDDLARHGQAPRDIVNPGAHSEFFSAISQTGTTGLFGLLMFYAGMIVPFWRRRHSTDPGITSAAYAGLAIAGSVIIFGLSIDALTSVMNAGFIALSEATLLAWIVARERETSMKGPPVALPHMPRNILVTSTRRLGDVLMATALVRSFKAQWPSTQIDMLVFEGTQSVLEGNPDVHRVITVAPRAKLMARIADMLTRWRRYDLACATLDSDRALLYTWSAGRTRIGVMDARHEKWLAHTLMHGVMCDDHLRMHMVSINVALTWLVGVTPRAQLVAPGLGEDNTSHVAQFMSHFGARQEVLAHGRLVVLHPYPMYRYKQWTVQGWSELAKWLHQHGFDVALSGGPASQEQEYAAQIVAAAGVPVLNLVGALRFAETAEMMRRACLYIGPDTGATHVAAACGIPVIALYGPTDPVRWAPWPAGRGAFDEPWPRHGSELRGNVYLIQGEKDCVPCRGEGCDKHPDSISCCLAEIPAQRVIAVIARWLGLPGVS
jgi:ADP-heptose:LPS heptosyltransferase/O-antigen ligase